MHPVILYHVTYFTLDHATLKETVLRITNAPRALKLRAVRLLVWPQNRTY